MATEAVRAVRCLLCGRSAGRMEGQRFVPDPSFAGHDWSRGNLRCPICSGPLFLDEIEIYHVLEKEAIQPRRRRGRPPKQRPVAGA